MVGPNRISAPSTVLEGEILVIQVFSNVDHVSILIQGRGIVQVKVIEGEARFQIPVGVTPGAIVTITDDIYPNPSTAAVTIVGLSP